MSSSAGTEIVVDSLGAKTYIIYLCNGSIGIYDKASDTRTLYQVTGDVNALKGPIAPAFKQPGGGIQYKLEVPISYLIKRR